MGLVLFLIDKHISNYVQQISWVKFGSTLKTVLHYSQGTMYQIWAFKTDNSIL